MNIVQNAAYGLIQSDARFVYTLTEISKNVKTYNNNFILMNMPYLGIFADGSAQWGKKAGLQSPNFTAEEKEYYTTIRKSHKLFEKKYDEFSALLCDKRKESDDYFKGSRSVLEKIIGYYNVGTDLYNGEFCGNTILCSIYVSTKIYDNASAGPWIRNMSVVAGKLAAFYMNNNQKPYRYNKDVALKSKDYNFYDNSPLTMNNALGIVLFSVLCSINYVIEFIDKIFIDEIPQKFKFAYIQYYYLCDFIKDLNARNNLAFSLDTSLYCREFRNCIAHYGLGTYISDFEIIEDDIMKGLTNKAFGLDYISAKSKLYRILQYLAGQIEHVILK